MARKFGKGCLIAAGLLAAVTVLSALVGTVAGLWFAFGAVGGESVDPSEKARRLAEGISEAMNCAAFAFVMLLPAAVVVAVGWWRRSKKSKAAIDAESIRP